MQTPPDHEPTYNRAPRAYLHVVAGPHRGLRVAVNASHTAFVGRGANLDMSLFNDEECSKEHARIAFDGESLRVDDLESKNGTFLVTPLSGGAFATKARVQSAQLNDNEWFRIGATILQVVYDRSGIDTQPSVEKTTLPKGFPKIPGYRITEILGRGGMGIVFKAERLADGVVVALKVNRFDKTVRLEDIKRFEREIRILESLNHPRIVGFYESNRVGRRHYFTMEYVVGENAEECLKRDGPMAIGRAVRLVAMMLDGLDYAHQQGFVHRDVKPNNLLICRDDSGESVKLADFGLSKAYTNSISELTPPGKILGAAVFIPPEQIADFRTVKPAGDQYSAAATLYFMLTGKPLFDIAGEIEVYKAVQTESPVPILERRADIPRPLADAIHTALRRDPATRFPSAAAFRDAIVPFAIR